jgi:hypothetical protein
MGAEPIEDGFRNNPGRIMFFINQQESNGNRSYHIFYIKKPSAEQASPLPLGYGAVPFSA